jgi:lysophospholipid acyltransferase (LPLAT)-like uncharacterized protein
VGGALLDSLFATVQYTVEGKEHYEQFTRAGKPVVFAIWHGRLLAPAYLHRGQGVVSLISASADGEYLARLLAHWGFGNVRGSSSRGGTEALRELVRTVRRGHSLAITPDGPRGPMQKLKPGVLLAAQLAGAPIIPATATATRGWWPGRWDRFLIPKPFASVRVRYAEPYFIPRAAGDAEIIQHALRVEQILNEMTADIDVA